MLRLDARRAALLAVLSLAAAAPAAAQRPCYGLLRFQSAPTQAQRAAWEARGVEILSYFKDESYRVRLARCRTGPALAESSGGILQLDAESRVEPDLWAGRFDEFRVPTPAGGSMNRVLNDDGTLNVVVTFYDSVPDAEVAAVLDAHTLERRRIVDGQWAVRIAADALQALAEGQVIQQIEPPPAPRRPDNDFTRTALGVDDVQRFDMATGLPAGLAGRGIRVGIFDFGIDEEHADLGARVVVNDMSPNYHGTHVAGIVAGEGTVTDGVGPDGSAVTGQRYQWRGMAPMALLLDVHAQKGDTAVTYQHYTGLGMHLSNHSYSVAFDGEYDSSTRLRDALIRGDARVRDVPVPARLQVYSAGNRGDWAPPASDRQGTQTGYFSLTKQMKNALVVGNVLREGDRWVIAPSSSMGPTHDGRIKPDLVAPGTDIPSTGYCDTQNWDDWDCGGSKPAAQIRDNYYRLMTGTSMAAPAVTGILALVLEQYRTTYGANALPSPAAQRAILINTAEDIAGPVMRQISEGPVQAFPGPDFVTGWGLVRAAEAVELVARRALADGTISASCDSVPFDFEVAAGSRVLRVTLAWDDVAADAGGNRLGPRLVNDLDLVLVDPSGVPHRPWLLDQVVVDASGVPVPDSAQRCGRRPTVRRSAIPVAADVPQPDPLQGAMLAAVRGRDHLNNVEQVLVDNPTPGRWRMWVVGFDVRWGPQPFAVAGPTIMP